MLHLKSLSLLHMIYFTRLHTCEINQINYFLSIILRYKKRALGCSVKRYCRCCWRVTERICNSDYRTSRACNAVMKFKVHRKAFSYCQINLILVLSACVSVSVCLDILGFESWMILVWKSQYTLTLDLTKSNDHCDVFSVK